jgi:hypothetical protein
MRQFKCRDEKKEELFMLSGRNTPYSLNCVRQQKYPLSPDFHVTICTKASNELIPGIFSVIKPSA